MSTHCKNKHCTGNCKYCIVHNTNITSNSSGADGGDIYDFYYKLGRFTGTREQFADWFKPKDGKSALPAINGKDGDGTIPDWDHDEGLKYPAVREHNGGIWKVKRGRTTTSEDEPVKNSTVWRLIANVGIAEGGGGVDPSDPENPEIPWQEIEDFIRDKVNEKVQDILDMIEDGQIDQVELGQLRAIMAGINADHARILQLIDLYQMEDTQLGSDLVTVYNTAYNALTSYVAPYLNGTITVITDKDEFSGKFSDYYTAKANIEGYTIARLNEDLSQAKITTELLNSITNFWQVQIYPDEGVIIAGTLAVGTKTINNAGITGVTDQGNKSVRIWAGSSFANRYNANFRVLDDGSFWVGTQSSGMDFGVTREGYLTLRGPIIQDAGGNEFFPPISRGEYNPAVIYFHGNIVKYGGSLWMYVGLVHANGGIPSEDNTNWELWLTTGNSVFRSYIYKRAVNEPARPTGGSFASPLPDPLDGWYDTPPVAADSNEKLWMSTRVFTQDGSAPQEAQWKIPTEAVDTDTLDVEWSIHDLPKDQVGTPTSHPVLWSNDSDNAVYMALRYKVAGIWTVWKIVRIKGENGSDGISPDQREYRYAVSTSWSVPPTAPTAWTRNPSGWTIEVPPEYNPTEIQYVWEVWAEIDMPSNSLATTWSPPMRKTGIPGSVGSNGETKFLAHAFLRSLTKPATPTGGDISDPKPTGWSDGIPQGTDLLWMVTRYFSSVPGGTDSTWSEPALPVDSATTEMQWSNSTHAFPGTPSAPLNSAEWSPNPTTLTGDIIYMAARYRANSTATFGAWKVFKIKGENGEASNVIPPLVVNRDVYNEDATYVGSPERVDVVIYGGIAYITRSNAGTITGIPPTNTDKWNTFSTQFDSIYSQVFSAVTAHINTLTTRELVIVGTNNKIRMTVGRHSPYSGINDPTKSAYFELAGQRFYHPEGRISAYTGNVYGFPYTSGGQSRNITGHATVVFLDEEGSPVHYVIDHLSNRGIEYITVPVSENWYPTNMYRFNSPFQGLSSNATGQDFSDMLAGSPELYIQDIFKGSINYESISGIVGINRTHLYQQKVKTGEATKYVTTQNGQTNIPDGWYIISIDNDSFGVNLVEVDPSTGATGWPTYVRLQLNATAYYISNGEISRSATFSITADIKTTSPTAYGAAYSLGAIDSNLVIYQSVSE